MVKYCSPNLGYLRLYNLGWTSLCCSTIPVLQVPELAIAKNPPDQTIPLAIPTHTLPHSLQYNDSFLHSHYSQVNRFNQLNHFYGSISHLASWTVVTIKLVLLLLQLCTLNTLFLNCLVQTVYSELSQDMQLGSE